MEFPDPFQGPQSEYKFGNETLQYTTNTQFSHQFDKYIRRYSVGDTFTMVQFDMIWLDL